MNPTTGDLVRSLRSTLCPACAKGKTSGRSFCGGCYHSLPAPLRKALYQRVGSGYEPAMAEAFAYLNVETPNLPTGDPR